MQAIRDAILSGDRTQETYANIEIPATYRGATVHKDEVEHVRGDRDPRQGPAQVAARRARCRCPSSAPGEALVAVMASAINYNTVWTSIFEPVLDVRLPRALRPHLGVRQAPRPALPRGRLRPRRRRPAHRPRRHQVEARHRGRRALPLVELEDAEGHDDTMLDPQQRIWGFETNFGGLAELAHRQGQPADAQAGPPDLGGGRLPRPGQLHGLPPADLQERRRA